MSIPSATALFIVLGISELGLTLFKRSGKAAQGKDRGSLGVLWLVIGIAVFLAIYGMSAWPQFGYRFSGASAWAGVVLFALGIALRWWAIIHLGRYFTVDVAIANDHRVVSDGPYRFVRHPSYSGVLLAFLGLGLLTRNWLSALLLVVPITAVFLWRINVEEHALSAALREEYSAYMRHTRRLVPFLY